VIASGPHAEAWAEVELALTGGQTLLRDGVQYVQPDVVVR